MRYDRRKSDTTEESSDTAEALPKLVAAGSVVLTDVPDFALVAGVPARRIRWVGRAGVPLEAGSAAGSCVCPATGETYTESGGTLSMDE